MEALASTFHVIHVSYMVCFHFVYIQPGHCVVCHDLHKIKFTTLLIDIHLNSSIGAYKQLLIYFI